MPRSVNGGILYSSLEGTTLKLYTSLKNNQIKLQQGLRRFKHQSAIMLSLCLMAPTALVAAQETPEPRWFSIQLIIFEQYFQPGYAEHWLPASELSYPENLVRFPSASSQSHVEAMFKELEFDGSLSEDLATLTRARGQRVLFSKHWQQGLLDKDNAPSIFIQGGKTINSNPELSGSINISVERYLHIHTNLWLAKFDAPQKTDSNLTLNNGFLLDKAETNNHTTEQLGVSLPTPYFGSQRNRNNRTAQSNTTTANNIIDSDISTSLDSPASAVYLLKHKRRLRSKETHYIDHPALGILVRIEPIDIPATEEAGDAIKVAE